MFAKDGVMRIVLSAEADSDLPLSFPSADALG